MEKVIIKWYKKYFSDPEAVILAVVLLLGLAIVMFMGHMLTPVLAAVIIAYLLEGLVSFLEKYNVARLPAVLIVYVPFMAFFIFLLLGLLPLLSSQVSQLVSELPKMIAGGKQSLLKLPDLYPQFITQSQVDELIAGITTTVKSLGQNVLSFSLASITGLLTLLVYFILVPVLVFFFLKDKTKLLGWLNNLLPQERALITRVSVEMNQQIGNYVRGKFAEILIVSVASYLVFAFMKLDFAILLGALTGISVIVPYIGATVVTLPVVLIGFFQWGWTSDLAYVLLAYGMIHAVDGNILVPWLFSEAVNLHPIAIIVAVLVFGGIWGFWGVFFAIPLATLVKAVMNAWPRSEVPREYPQ